ncbi:MAG: type II toxin-antitoxin system VapC family toxin [Cryobacterium sp.]|uniref:type II toxin-antitoxin system VapC family toxin n=1 Tax=unclassified Cryobacterium TaxID=2649013 RepID=UPI0018CB1DBC|nr:MULTISPECIES: type II toxin-antitoxin system VapC family toxin [unclassified Cryobacterium]MCY7404892.1 type II toxin-antitoxin system VapC family toxin [Cryobacterium sp.]MEC5153301.1 putative nucleic acid-binding protein [Cryobacterium sp. CAN_C3]
MITYLDTSAVAKLISDEPESPALTAHLDDVAGDSILVSATLLETELRRTATRTRIPQTDVTAIISQVTLLEMDRALCREAGLIQGTSLRSLDAMHIAAALRSEADEFITYDAQQSAAAAQVGLHVVRPE